MDRETDTDQTVDRSSQEQEVRKRAISRLRNQRDFRTHLAVYLAVNATLVLIWFMTGAPIFWPIFPIIAWGMGLAAHAWDAFGHPEFSEDRIQREIDRMRS